MGWLQGWSYRKSIGLPQTATEQSDLNFMITVEYNGNMKSDMSDIRFTDSDGITLLSQFRESVVESSQSIWWIKVPQKPAAGKTVYLYYGNGSASLESDGEQTFPLFDSFSGDGVPPDSEKWDYSGLIELEDNKLWMHSNNAACWSIDQSYGLYYGVRAKAMNNTTSKEPIRRVGFLVGSDAQAHHHGYYDYDGVFENGYGVAVSGGKWDYNIWHMIEIRREKAELTRCKWDDEEFIIDGSSNPDLGDQWGIGIRNTTSYIPTVSFYVDFMFVFKISDSGESIETIDIGDEEEFSSFNEGNVIFGVGELEVDGVNVGYFINGVTFSYERQNLEVDSDNQVGKVKIEKVGEVLLIKTTLLEMSLRNLKLAWELSEDIEEGTDRDSLSFGGDDNVSYHSLWFTGNGPENKVRFVNVYKVFTFEASPLPFRKKEVSRIDVVFKAVEDRTKEKGKRLGRIIDI